jgi:hypothetical protein
MNVRIAVLTLLLPLGLSGCVAPLLPDSGPDVVGGGRPAVAPDTQVFVYPTASQSGAQLDRDRYECNAWAVRQTGFDPSLPVVAPHQRVQVVSVAPQGSDVLAGAATGAIIGAAVSRPRASGEGAIIGAIAGTLLGAASDQARQQQAAELNQRLNSRGYGTDASLEARAANFRRAISACLEGRGYTVK